MVCRVYFYYYRIRQCWCYPGRKVEKIGLGFQRDFEESFSNHCFYLFPKSLGQNCEIILFFLILCGWIPVSCPGASMSWIRWSDKGCYISWDDPVGGIIIEYFMY